MGLLYNIYMTNISVEKTTSSDYTLAYKELLGLISNLNKRTSPIFLDELFTASEKIMIVKRFAALVLFSHNYSSYRVASAISISLSTSQRLYQQYAQGDFERLLTCFTTKQKSQFVSIIEDFILSKASPRARTRFLNRLNTLH
jgi:hypothetical protein